MAKSAGKIGIVLGAQSGDSVIVFQPSIYPSSQVKSLGFRWQSQQKVWATYATLEAYNGLKNYFPNTEDLDTTQKWIHEKQNEQPEIAITVANANVESLFDYQAESVSYLASRKRALLALAPGLGKTACAVRAADAIGAKKILVVGPLSLLRTWKNEIKKWSPDCGTAILYKMKPWDGEAYRWNVTNYDTVVRNQEAYTSAHYDLLIIDESVMIKNRQTARAKSMTHLALKMPYVWLLSGGPITKFYDDIWSQFHLLDRRRFSSYWRFAARYCEIESTRWGSQIIRNKDDAATFIKQDMKDIYFCRTQAEALPNLPDWIMENVEIEMSPRQTKVYTEMENTFKAQLSELPDDVVIAPNVLTQLLRLVQFASNPLLVGGVDDSNKWAAVKEMAEYLDKPIIVWTTYIRTASEIQKELGKSYRVAVLTGSTKEVDRQTIVDKFQAGELDILVAHPAVGKFGLTLTASHTAIYLERSFMADDYYQSIHRIRRIGTTQAPQIIHLLSTKSGGGENGHTVDHVVAAVLDYRKNSTMELTAGMLKTLF